MRVCGITSWAPRACGIATYFSEQSHAIGKLGHEFEIVCHTDEGRHEGQPAVHPIIDVKDKGWPVRTAAYIADEIGPDLVHMQHEFGLYQADYRENGARIVDLVAELRERGLPVVVTYLTLIGRMRPEHK